MTDDRIVASAITRCMPELVIVFVAKQSRTPARPGHSYVAFALVGAGGLWAIAFVAKH